MKILLLKKDITDNETLNQGIVLAKKEALRIGLTLDFTIKETSQSFSSVPVGNGQSVVNSIEIFKEGINRGYVFEEDAIVCLVYDWSKIKPQPTNPAMSGLSMQIPMQFYVTFPNVFMEFFLHELSHYYLGKNGKPDITHNYSPEFSQLPRQDWYLHLIKPFIEETISEPIESTTYKYFSDKEVKFLDLEPSFQLLVDNARDYANIPFVGTSGRRSVAYNKKVGGSSTSAHLTGTGVDIRARNWTEVFKIVFGAMKSGIIGITVYTKSKHVHMDMKSTRLEVLNK